MGKRGSNKKGSKQPNSGSGSRMLPTPNLSLREEASGKKQTNVNPRFMLKLDHLKNLASWAGTEASVPPLAAFYGQRLAASAEALGLPPDPSLFTCQRCESILRPGSNCTVRIEKNQSKMRKRKKSSIPSQNTVCYNCHFCGYRNSIRGTPKGHMQVICPQKLKPPLKPNLVKAADRKSREQKNIKGLVPHADTDYNKAKSIDPQMDLTDAPGTDRNDNEVKSDDSQIDKIALPDAERNDNEANCPATPFVKTGISLLDSKMRKRNRSGAKRTTDCNSTSASVDVELEAASKKKKRKGWTSLKEIVESNEKDRGRNCGNLKIPFFI